MRSIATLLVATLSLSALAGCGSSASDGPSDGPRAVTSVYALQFLTERIGGDEVTVTNLTSPGQEPHDLELGLQQTAELSDADVAVYLSGFQPAVDEAMEQNGPERVVDAAESADLVPSADSDEVDPHFWLDPVRMAAVAADIEAALAEADPDHAEGYAARLEDLTGQLDSLDRQYQEGLADCEVDTVVVSHDAFGYLSRYGPTFAAVNGLSPDAEPSLDRIAALEDLIGEDGVTTVFYETLVSPDLARTLADDVGVRTAVLDPLEGLTDESAGEDYLSLMRANLEALRSAGACR